VVRLEVRHARRPHQAFPDEIEDRAVRLDVLVDARQRPVDQEEIDVVEGEEFQAPQQGRARLVIAMIPAAQLRRDEQFIARHAPRRDPPPHPGLVPVARGGIDQAIPLPDRQGHRRSRPIVIQRPRPQANQRHRVAGIQRDRWNL